MFVSPRAFIEFIRRLWFLDRLEYFERVISVLANYFVFVAPPSFAIVMLFPQDRIFLGITIFADFCCGLVMKYALRGFKTNPRRALGIIENVLYLVVASGIVTMVYLMINDPFYRSVMGLVFTAFDLVVSACIVILVRRTVLRAIMLATSR